MHELQRQGLCRSLDLMMKAARDSGLTDQQVCEWMLKLSAGWLKSHGVSVDSIHQWLELALGRKLVLRPLTAAARARNDFGGMR